MPWAYIAAAGGAGDEVPRPAWVQSFRYLGGIARTGNIAITSTDDSVDIANPIGDEEEHFDLTVSYGGGGALGYYIHEDIFEAEGDLLIGTGDGTYAVLSLGAACTILHSTGSTVEWTTDYIKKSIVDAKGDFIVGTADNTVARLAPPEAVGVMWYDYLTELPAWLEFAEDGELAAYDDLGMVVVEPGTNEELLTFKDSEVGHMAWLPWFPATRANKSLCVWDTPSSRYEQFNPGSDGGFFFWSTSEQGEWLIARANLEGLGAGSILVSNGTPEIIPLDPPAFPARLIWDGAKLDWEALE